MPINLAAGRSEMTGSSSGLVQHVAPALQTSGLDPHTVVLEVAESAVMDDAEAGLAILNELKRLGAQLSIDDFGIGYSSPICPKRFPVDQLNVDRTLVDGLCTDPVDSTIVERVVSLARALSIVSVAEGVGTVQQRVELKRRDSQFGQAFPLSRPRPAAELDLTTGSGGSSDWTSAAEAPNPISSSAAR
jgi:EAL domain-containing protein (putative c-di-GMP-specific phosphodiesterase class I)